MIWEQGVELVVNLTRRFDGDVEKCALYWPEGRRTSKVYGNFEVDLFQIDLEEGYFVRHMEVENLKVGTVMDMCIQLVDAIYTYFQL
jgi:protein tyrosine phosphatase